MSSVAGLTAPVLLALTDRISSLLASHATSLSPTRTPEKYFLVSRVSHCGTALWVFAREKTLLGRVGKVLSSGLGLWWGGMGNKAAVGVRMPVKREGKAEGWETLTWVQYSKEGMGTDGTDSSAHTSRRTTIIFLGGTTSTGISSRRCCSSHPTHWRRRTSHATQRICSSWAT